MTSRTRDSEYAYDYHAAPTEELPDGVLKNELPHEARKRRSSKVSMVLIQTLLWLPLLILALFGILHILLVVFGRVPLFWDIGQYKQYLSEWGKPGRVGEGLGDYPTDATRNVLPIPCHSHNDYWRRVPLFDAIHFGCTSVEADVWLFEGHEELYIGHNTASLTPNRTFSSLYVDPLVNLLDKMNRKTEFNDVTGHGVFDENPKQTLVLLVDLKTNGHDLFPHVQRQLEPLRRKNYLSYWNGDKLVSRAVTVVGTGNTPFDLVVQNKTYRDIFFDAPLDEMWELSPKAAKPGGESPLRGGGKVKSRSKNKTASLGQGKTGTSGISSVNDFNTSTSYYASVSFKEVIGFPWTGQLSSKQLELIQGQIRGAKRRGLKARYWETPSWPTSLRNHIWEVLLREGVNVLNVDDLKGAAVLDWNIVKHDWLDAR